MQNPPKDFALFFLTSGGNLYIIRKRVKTGNVFVRKS